MALTSELRREGKGECVEVVRTERKRRPQLFLRKTGLEADASQLLTNCFSTAEFQFSHPLRRNLE